MQLQVTTTQLAGTFICVCVIALVVVAYRVADSWLASRRTDALDTQWEQEMSAYRTPPHDGTTWEASPAGYLFPQPAQRPDYPQQRPPQPRAAYVTRPSFTPRQPAQPQRSTSFDTDLYIAMMREHCAQYREAMHRSNEAFIRQLALPAGR